MNKFKKLASFLIIFTFIIQMMQSFVFERQVSASDDMPITYSVAHTTPDEAEEDDDDEINLKYITGVYIKTEDFQNQINDDGFKEEYQNYLNQLKDTKIKKDSEVFIAYNFKIPNDDRSFDISKQYTIDLPDEIKSVSRDVTWNLNEYATATLTTGNKIKIKFNDRANDESNIEGNIYLSGHFDKDKIGDENPVDITFPTHSDIGDVKFDLKFEQPPFVETEPSIAKSGEYSAKDKAITWKITVDPGNMDRDNAQVIDDLNKIETTEDGEVNNIEHKYINGSLMVNGESKDDSYFQDNKLNYTFDNILKNQKQEISFKTRPNDEYLQNGSVKDIKNRSELKIDNGDKHIDKTSDAKVSVANNFVSKSGQYNPLTHDIDWSIVVNKSKIDMTKPNISDTIPTSPSGLSLDTSSVKVYNEDNEEVTGAGTLNADSSGFTYQFNNNIDKTYTIKYSTKVDRSVLQGAFKGDKVEYNNSSKITFDGNSYTAWSGKVGVGVQGNVISKNQAQSYDPETHKIKWQIDVDEIGINLENAIIIEKIGTGQKYVEGSLSCDPNDLGSLEMVQDKDENGQYIENQYKINIGNITNKHIITLETEVIDKSIIYSNKIDKCTNSCTLESPTIDNENTGNIPAKVDGSILSKKGALSNHFNNDRTITWTIEVNSAQLPLTGITLTDVIKEGQDFEGSEPQISDVTDPAAVPLGTVSYNNHTKTITYSLGSTETIHHKYLITYKTKAADDKAFYSNDKVNINNDAQLNVNIEGVNNITASAHVTPENYLIKKEASYTDGDDFVTWKVKVNKNKVLLKNATITDVIPDGLQLDLESVKLYKVNNSEDAENEVTAGTASKVDESAYSYTYDNENRSFVVNLPQNTNDSYYLDFDTLASESGESYANKISISDGNISAEPYTTQSADAENVSFAKFGGAARGTSGTVILSKADKDNESKKLKGAKFVLINKDKNPDRIIQTSGETDDNGEASFRHLKFDTNYIVREIKAPNGYKLDSEDTNVLIKNSDLSKIKNLTFYDKEIKKTIELKKIDGHNNPLKGAEFKLYKEDDINYESPIDTALSDENGFVHFNGVSKGGYLIKETQAPDGYVLNENADEIKAYVDPIVGNDGDIIKCDPYEIKNGVVIKTIKFVKKSEDETPLKGAYFTIYNKSDIEFNNPIKTVISDDDGNVELKNIELSDYIIKETQAPDGYEINETPIIISSSEFLTDDQTIKTDDVCDKHISNKLIRRNIRFFIRLSNNKRPLKGAIFSLFALSDINYQNPIATTVSDEDGNVEFTNIPKGNYKIKQIKAASGYQLSSDIVEVKDSDFEDINPVINTSPYIVADSTNSSENNSNKTVSKHHSSSPSSTSDKEKVKEETKNDLENNDQKTDNSLNSSSNSENRQITKGLLKSDALNSYNADTSEKYTNQGKAKTEQKQKSANDKADVKKLPQSGSILDMKILIIIGCLLIFAGAAYNVLRKYRKSK